MGLDLKMFFLLFIFSYFFLDVDGRFVVTMRTGSEGTFDVKKFGARANGRTDDSKAFLSAWEAACSSSGSVTLVVPAGTYLLGPTQFHGPCKKVQSLTVLMQGTAKATTDLAAYPKAVWVEFGYVANLTLTGGGTFDGQGAVSWPFNKCPTQKQCEVLPTSIMFTNTTNTVVDGIVSLNSKFFHIAVLGCTNFTGTNIEIAAPGNSPNTDGIHLERNSGVSIAKSKIGTGDDCVSVGAGNSDVSLRAITCGPGHGISVGSLGRYKGEGDVSGLTVSDCTLTGTTNGVRIKTWEDSPGPSAAANMTFENIVMNNVANPIIIDQTYCPYAKCTSNVPSRVKISHIRFRNIRGTSTTPEAVILRCSKGMPCQNVTLHDIDLTHVGGAGATATCLNVKAAFSGTLSPPPCINVKAAFSGTLSPRRASKRSVPPMPAGTGM